MPALAKWRSGGLAFSLMRKVLCRKGFVRKSESATFIEKWRTRFLAAGAKKPSGD
jgi:hypothetical protein